MSEQGDGSGGNIRSRLEELAYQQGRRDADVDARLLSHERRLNAINGSIERHARNADKLSKSVEETREALEHKMDALIAAQGARDAVAADREKQDEKSEKRILDRQTFVVTAIGIAITLGLLIVAVLTLIFTTR